MRVGMALVAMAGPLSNLILATLSVGVLALIARLRPDLLFAQDGRGALVYLLRAMYVLNVGLFVFNLLPIPPLDGSRLLPRSLDAIQESLAPMSLLLLLLILYNDTLRTWLLERPVRFVGGALEQMVGLTAARGPIVSREDRERRACRRRPSTDVARKLAEELAAERGAAAYRISLENFEGPLDLLLHLIQQHELDIMNIPIGFITSKYVEYIV